MSKNLKLTVRDGANGKIAILNGKTYTLLRLHAHTSLDGVFFLAVAGRTPLRADDLDQHWKVIRHGQVYFGLNCRAFSYHLMLGEGTATDTPRWPGLKVPGTYYAFVGPDEEAVKAQIRLTLERYRSCADPDQAIASAVKVSDQCGGPPAYLLRSDEV